MKTKGLRFVCIAVLVVAFILLVACGNGASPEEKPDTSKTEVSSSEDSSSNFNPTGFPIVKEKITLKGLTSKHPYHAPWGEMTVFKEYEKLTNINIEWENVPDDAWVEKRNLKLASGDLPDFIARSNMTDSDVSLYASQRIFIPLNDLIEEYAPNLVALFEENPGRKKSITSPDGKIYGLASYNSGLLDTAQKLMINKAWLDQIGMEIPTTLDEYYEAMLALKEKNPAGVEGLILLSDFSNNMNRFIQNFAGSFGLGTKGADNFLANGVDIGKDGKMRFAKIDPAYKELLQYLNKLWTAGIMDPESFTHKAEDWIANCAANKVASYWQTTLEFSANKDEWEVCMPLEGPYGDCLVSGINPGTWKNNVVITSANKYPAETIRWFDYWYSEEGSVEQFYGIEGINYDIIDGNYILKDEFNPSVAPPEKSRGLFSPNYGGGIPYNMISFEEYPPDPDWWEGGGFAKVSASLDKLIKPYIPESYETFTFTDEELKIINDFKNEALQYVLEMEAKFIIGDAPFSEWDNYVDNVKKMNLDEYMSAWNAANERFNK